MSKTFTYSHRLLAPFTAQQVFDVVSDVPNYHQFLPNCTGSGVVSRSVQADGERVVGFMDLSVMGMRYRLDSNNLNCAPHSIHMQLLKGPFKSLTGRWDIQPVGDVGCSVSLNMQWQYDSAILAMTIGQRFDSIAKQLLDAFMAETARRST